MKRVAELTSRDDDMGLPWVGPFLLRFRGLQEILGAAPGEENGITLPWSRASGSISNRYHESIPGDRRVGIEPDLELARSSADYFGDRDPLLEAVRQAYRPPAGR